MQQRERGSKRKFRRGINTNGGLWTLSWVGGEKVLEAEWIMKNLLSNEVEEVLEGELSDQNDLEKYEVVVVKLKSWRRYSYWCQYLWGMTMGWVTQVG